MGVDHNDDVWYTSFYTDVTGKLDPRTANSPNILRPTGEKKYKGLKRGFQGKNLVRAESLFQSGLLSSANHARDGSGAGR